MILNYTHKGIENTRMLTCNVHKSHVNSNLIEKRSLLSYLFSYYNKRKVPKDLKTDIKGYSS